jgi:hypothetical protein
MRFAINPLCLALVVLLAATHLMGTPSTAHAQYHHDGPEEEGIPAVALVLGAAALIVVIVLVARRGGDSEEVEPESAVDGDTDSSSLRRSPFEEEFRTAASGRRVERLDERGAEACPVGMLLSLSRGGGEYSDRTVSLGVSIGF